MIDVTTKHSILNENSLETFENPEEFKLYIYILTFVMNNYRSICNINRFHADNLRLFNSNINKSIHFSEYKR